MPPRGLSWTGVRFSAPPPHALARPSAYPRAGASSCAARPTDLERLASLADHFLKQALRPVDDAYAGDTIGDSSSLQTRRSEGTCDQGERFWPGSLSCLCWRFSLGALRLHSRTTRSPVSTSGHPSVLSSRCVRPAGRVTAPSTFTASRLRRCACRLPDHHSQVRPMPRDPRRGAPHAPSGSDHHCVVRILPRWHGRQGCVRRCLRAHIHSACSDASHGDHRDDSRRRPGNRRQQHGSAD